MPDISGVAFDGAEQTGAPQIDPNAQGQEIGPDNNNSERQDGKNIGARTLISAVVFGPGLYNVAAQIASLAEIEKLSPKPRVITGMGMGAWIAALYAFGQTPQLIEWKLFKFLSASEGVTPFTKEWREILADKLLGELEDADISEAKMVLLLPVYDRNQNGVHYLKRGKLREILLANVMTQTESKTRFSTSLEWRYFSRSDLGQAHVDFILGLDVLDEDVRFEKPNDYLMGIFGRLIGWRTQVRDQFDYLLQLPWNSQLDSTKRLSFNMLEARKFAESKHDEIQEMMNSMREKKFKKE